ncbi:ABC transporter ATP-binding protein [Puniceibacterium sp. IMCC21224]|uniref:ABC transporter ATP-binding protein n=1 Tax=Puniceibacterium sp. IMCC21224 TaxID=1618204 RepID=UPI00064D906B|nr:ABC transporter ATP-binding protein [Puniceibacterium sp. IMCC21224]KMK63866.1 ABC-type branched-chain amino acid transport system, ATPase component [Puniceibacterium sp. IMCC21224]
MTSTSEATKPAAARLSVRDLTVELAGSRVLDGVTFDVGQAPLAILGRNGMGKTTLCNAITGLAPISGGEISFGGPLHPSPHVIARRGIGYVPQGRRLFPSLTVEETLVACGPRTVGAFPLERLWSMFPRLYERRATASGLLSGGEQQMLAIARALRGGPSFLVMDEPTEGLAPAYIEGLIATIHDLVCEGIGLLLVEQNLSVAARLADEAIILVNGRSVARLSTKSAMEDADVQKTYLGVAG